MAKKIKIGIIGLNTTQLFYPDSKIGFGGSEVQLHLLAHLLAKDGYEVELLMKSDSGIPSKKRNGANLTLTTISNYTL